MSSQKRGIGERVNAWLDEAPGEVFRHGKWRFWFVALIAFSLLNAALTALVFDAGGVLQTHMGSVLVGVGALLAWIGVGSLHYSDSNDSKLARGVSALDSVTLLFVVAHFCFLTWVYGHTATLKSAEADHKAEVEKFNAKASEVQANNAKIADALKSVAESEAKRARIENDSLYQARRAAQAGARVQTGRSQSVASGIALSPVELAKPPAPPKQSSADYLTEWDAWVRLANFGELGLAILTLVFIRNRTSQTNARQAPQSIQTNYIGERDYVYLPDGRKRVVNSTYDPNEVGMIVDPDYEFSDAIDANIKQDHRAGRRFDQTRKSDIRRQSPDSAIPVDREKALRSLRTHLKEIAFYCPGFWFRADLLHPAGVVIRMFRRHHGLEETVSSTRQSDKLLHAVNHPDFRARLIGELTHQRFPIQRKD